MFLNDPLLEVVLAIVLGMLIIASVVVSVIKQRTRGEESDVVRNLTARTKAWWMIVAVMVVSAVIGKTGLFVFYALLSMLALREFISAMDTKAADHRTLAWIFFAVIPVQFALAFINWYVMFLIFVPVYCFVLIPARMALAGDPDGFLKRSATIQWGVLMCVYFVSYLPMLLNIHVQGLPPGSPRLIFFLVLVTQLSDILQYTFGKLFGRRQVAPVISPNKTTEGLVLGGLGAVCIGTGLWWVTPFPWYGAALVSVALVVAGFLGGLVMSAIKRDLHVKDWGTMIAGHGGVMDRLDSLIFSAPIYFHIVVFYAHVNVGHGPSDFINKILNLSF
jgi:phosphatidate cytidylyltransferase